MTRWTKKKKGSYDSVNNSNRRTLKTYRVAVTQLEA